MALRRRYHMPDADKHETGCHVEPGLHELVAGGRVGLDLNGDHVFGRRVALGQPVSQKIHADVDGWLGNIDAAA